jgi:cytochrome c oxidase cbb3-type subunit 2
MMNRLSFVLIGAVGVLIFTAVTLVVIPYMQFHTVQPEDALMPPTPRQAEGREVYVSLGCVYCHTQQPRDRAFGPDERRGWGRPSTPGDYAYDYPHQLGTMRTGPDLFNVGARLKSRDWHLSHLRQPRDVVPGSIMPSYPFLFERKASAALGDVVVGREPGGAVWVAGHDALVLVDYLVSLDHTYPSSYLPRGTAAVEVRP